jgi:hypothetical protein
MLISGDRNTRYAHRMRHALVLAVLLSVAEVRGDSPRCQVMFKTNVMRMPDGTVVLTAVMSNLTRAPIEVVLPERCPSGPIAFSGLGAKYDYYGVCAATPCQPLAAEQRRSIPSGTHELARTAIDPRGTACAPPLAPARYTITFPPPRLPAHVRACSSASPILDLRRPPPVRKRPPKRSTCENANVRACDLFCPNGEYLKDAEGCSLCACAFGTPLGLPTE